MAGIGALGGLMSLVTGSGASGETEVAGRLAILENVFLVRAMESETVRRIRRRGGKKKKKKKEKKSATRDRYIP